MSHEKQQEPCLFVVFGATGDLNRRKLLPALARLAERNVLNGSHILGVARSTQMNEGAFRELARKIVGDGIREWCDSCVHYRVMNDSLAVEIAALERDNNLPGNRVFYLALPPQSFTETIDAIGRSGLNDSSGWTRIVIERP